MGYDPDRQNFQKSRKKNIFYARKTTRPARDKIVVTVLKRSL